MNRSDTDILIEPTVLRAQLDDDRLLVVDLSKPESYAESHIPGAVSLDYRCLVDGRTPAPGRLPPPGQLSALAQQLGLDGQGWVVAYDDEGGGKAGRLLWTLHILGHATAAVLNGGIHAWRHEGHPLSHESAATAPAVRTEAPLRDDARATRDYILDRLGDAGIGLLDARTPEEYAGTRVRALRGGHIPGAVNVNWLDTIDTTRHTRLKPDTVLQDMLERVALTPDKEIVVYCQTHHRSAHSYTMLKHLGYDRVRAYDGSWSEWGNDPSLPIE